MQQTLAESIRAERLPRAGSPPRRILLGRAAERRALELLLDNVRGGQSAVLVLRGEAGVGKTALAHHCARQAAGFRVVRVTGVEVEMELPFAGAHSLCAPLLDGLDSLPAPQREALAVALGLAPGDAPDRFLVSLAVLGLLCAAAQDRPLLCLVDDAQWLDEATSQVLGFVARRLLAESVALVLAVREPARMPGLDGLPELPLTGLGEADARALLARVIPGRVDDQVRDRLLAETRGNPLAILELPRGMGAAQLAGGFEIPAAEDLPRRIERRYVERIRALPEATRQFLLLAAAERVGDAAVLWRAAQHLGLAPGALDPAADDGLVESGAVVRFRHPLVRSAAYRVGSAGARRRVHAALADACDPEADADRRAWHRALATLAPDEDVADELERSAGRAQTRGGLAAAAAFLARATALTPDPGRRAERSLAAAELKLLSGAPETALELIGGAESGGRLDAFQAARAHRLRGQAASGSTDGREAPARLLAAARELEPLDPLAARDTLLDALSAGLLAGRHAGGIGIAEVARAARAAPAAQRPQDLLLDGISAVVTDGHEAGVPLLERAVRAFRTTDMPTSSQLRWLWPATHAARELWDDEAWEALSERHVALARNAGALAVLPIALTTQVDLHLLAGELGKAATRIEEIVAVAEATRTGLPPYGALALAAFRGDEADATGLIQVVRAAIGERGNGMGLTLVEHAEAILYNGLGRYGEACAAAQQGAAHPDELGFSTWSLAELVEAAARDDEPALARDAFERLARSTRASGTSWALGVEARARALVSDGQEAERWYREAIDRLDGTRMRSVHARAQLVYGEWLRREGRRVAAREHLRAAQRGLAEMGMGAFAERARRELVATGERVRARGPETRDELTPQELQIAQLARDGLSNPEIGARLFLSPRTVEWHMKKIFTKLGIKSRIVLHDALSQREPPVATTA